MFKNLTPIKYRYLIFALFFTTSFASNSYGNIKSNYGNVIKFYVTAGNSIQLNCHPRQSIKCSWFRNGTVVEIGGRYHYVNRHGDYHSDDCSFQIVNIKSIDFSRWECKSQVDHDHLQVHVHKVFQLLKEETPLRVQTKSTNEIIETSTKVDLNIAENNKLKNTDESKSKENENTNHLNLSSGLIIVIASSNVVLVAVIVGGVIFACKYFNKQKQTEPKVAKIEENVTPIEKTDTTSRIVYVNNSHAYANEKAITGCLVPSVPLISPQQVLTTNETYKHSKPISRNDSFETHVYETVIHQ